MKFQLKADFTATGDQPQAIESLIAGAEVKTGFQVLLGVTGSGKTFSIANVIAKLQRPTLVISHNKTLAAQLYQEFRDFFPQNAVSYFVSYYDYYQPEAYLPQSDTYIAKETEINEQIDMLRLAATTNLLTRRDTIVVASVSCIYNLGSPVEYEKFVLELARGMRIERRQIIKRLLDLMYTRDDLEFRRSAFRVRGNILDVFPAYHESAIRLQFEGDYLIKMSKLHPFNGTLLANLESTVLYPAKHYMSDRNKYEAVFKEIRKELSKQVRKLNSQGKTLEAHRLSQRTRNDLEMINLIGFVNGIENYSRYFDGRLPGEPPYTLLDYFSQPYGQDWLLIIDESHMTIPQIRGMYNGDISRKQTLVDFGFRLPSALDNRPLKFSEFLARIPQTIFVSATPDEYELNLASKNGKKFVAEQLIRPTGILDPQIKIKPTVNQVEDLILEIRERINRQERVLVTTLTKRMAEDLTEYLNNLSRHPSSGRKVTFSYLHSDIATLDRQDILDDLRSGVYDVVIGINLLREGLDLPEVSLVAIMDADKEGFLRSKISLIQTMGRASRHVNGTVIMYADKITRSMKEAINEVNRRRNYQIAFNLKHHINPKTITKPYREKLVAKIPTDDNPNSLDLDIEQLLPLDRVKFKRAIRREMYQAAKNLDFEKAARLRDKLKLL